MNIRKTTSLVATLAFVIMILTSIILYIVPQGRIAYWAGWKLFGLSKTEWGNIHITTGILFLITLGLHTFYNWGAIVKYLKNRSKRLILFTREFNIALTVVLFFVLGTYSGIQPFSGILNISADIKEKAIATYGEPPWGHAELSSLKTFTGKMRLDPDQSLEMLSTHGIHVTGENQTLLSIGENNGITPQKVFEIIKQAGQKTNNAVLLPDLPPAGFGKMSLAGFCKNFKMDIARTIKHLGKKNIIVRKEMTIKEIASKNNTLPMDLYELFKNESF